MLTQNSKLKKTSLLTGNRVFNFGIPAGLTCPQAGICAKFCYAKKGAYAWSNVKPAFKRRWEATKQDNFPELMRANILKVKATHIRIHDSGDFYNMEYLNKWLKVIESLPNVVFYAYTKSLDLFEGLTLPVNFTVIYSQGGKLDANINMSGDRHSRIFESLDELNAAGYANASDNDLLAISCNKKIGLLKH